MKITELRLAKLFLAKADSTIATRATDASKVEGDFSFELGDRVA